MKKLGTFYLFWGLPILMMCHFNDPEATKKQSQSKKIMIKFEDFQVTEHDFHHQLEMIKLSSDSTNLKKETIELLKAFIIMGLFCVEADKQQIYKNSEIKKQLSELKNETIIQFAQKYAINNVAIKEKDLLDCYERSKIELHINYVTLNQKGKNFVTEIADYLRAGGEDFSKYSAIANFNKIILRDGVLKDNRLKSAYNMKIGELKVIRSNEGIDIIQLIDRRRAFKNQYEIEREKIAEHLAKLTLINQKKFIFADNLYDQQIYMNPKVLSEYVSLAIHPLSDCIIERQPGTGQDQLVASLYGKKITSRDLLNEIIKLPGSVQFYFRNRTTRIKAVQTLLMMMNGQKPKPIDYVRSRFPVYNNMVSAGKISLTESYPWLYPEIAYTDLDSLALDCNPVMSFNIPNPKIKNGNQVVAQKDAWALCVDDYKNKWGDLSPEGKKKLFSQRILSWNKYLDLQKEMIRCIEKNENLNHKTNKEVWFNDELIMNLDLANESEMNYPVLNGIDTVLSFNDFSLNLDQIRSKICSKSLFSRRKFDNIATRKKALESLFIEEFWLDQAYRLHLESEPALVEKIEKMKNQLMAPLYLKKILDDITGSEIKLNVTSANMQNDSLFTQKMDYALNELIEKSNFFVDSMSLRRFGITADLPSLMKQISFSDLTTKVYSIIFTRGKISRECWMDIPGKSIDDLYDGINLVPFPLFCDQINATQCPEPNWADYYGMKMKGLLHPAENAYYTFWTFADDDCEFWLSNSENPANKKKISAVYGWTSDWELLKYDTQKSAPQYLEAGKCYYFEILFKENNGGEHYSVLWEWSGHYPEVITGNYISPFF